LWIAAWLIAELVPVFSDLLGLTNDLFVSWFTFGLAGMTWIQTNWPTRLGKTEIERYVAGPAWMAEVGSFRGQSAECGPGGRAGEF